MRIIEQSYEILKFSETPEQDIELSARTCYKSEDKIIDDSANDLVRKLVNRNHLAMIEFGDATVKFITDRGVTHEFVRHRLCSLAQESTRYVNYKSGAEFILPVFWDKWTAVQQSIWKESMSNSEYFYKSLIERGASPQEARSVLPNSLKTELVVKANLREWMHIFSLRCSKAAHPQIRELLLPLLDEFCERCPVVFEGIRENLN